ncbi:MAG: tetratricopeptide repeat protein, partial [Planctomycetaceae bacterium]|nr:tetratricopeptide repeat protein [Planctomycetaceae bacterium]
RVRNGPYRSGGTAVERCRMLSKVLATRPSRDNPESSPEMRVRWSEQMCKQPTTHLARMILAGICILPGCGTKDDTASTSAGIPLSISHSRTSDAAATEAAVTGQQIGSETRVTSPAGPESASASSTQGTAAVTEQAGWANPAVAQLVARTAVALKNGQHLTAIESLSQAIGNDPDDARLFRMRADVYSLLGENANARADFTTAIRIRPDDADLYNYRGYFLMSAGVMAEAMADFNEAVRLNPQHAAALNNRGLIRLAAGEHEAAVSDFSAAVDAQRLYTDAWNNRGFANYKLEKYDVALADLQQAIRLKNDYVTAWNNCGMVYMAQEKYSDAENAFTKAIELAPLESRWFANRGAALLKQEKFAAAQADAAQVAWLTNLSDLTAQAMRDGRNPDAWIRRGQHLLNGSQFGAAAQDFTRALQVNPGDTRALTGRAIAWLAMGDTQKAVMDCDESLVSNPSAEAYSVRGDIWLKLNNPEQAIADYEAAQRFDETVAIAYDRRAEEREQAGKSEDAAVDREKAQQIRSALSGSSDQPKVKAPELPADVLNAAPTE